MLISSFVLSIQSMAQILCQIKMDMEVLLHLRLLLKKRAVKTVGSKILKSQMSKGILRSMRKDYSTPLLAVGIVSQVQTMGAREGQFRGSVGSDPCVSVFPFLSPSFFGLRQCRIMVCVYQLCDLVGGLLCFLALVPRLHSGYNVPPLQVCCTMHLKQCLAHSTH